MLNGDNQRSELKYTRRRGKNGPRTQLLSMREVKNGKSSCGGSLSATPACNV